MQRMPKRPKRNKEFWRHAYSLMERFPSPLPVEVRIVASIKPFEGGECMKDGNRFRITLEEMPVDAPQRPPCKMTWRERCLLDDFLHEYAHVLNWSHLHDRSDYAHFHGADWGTWYAKLYASWSESP